MIDGVTKLIRMKSDVLDGFDTIKVATEYIVDGERTSTVPFDTYAEITPVYREFRGWKQPLSHIRKEEDLPLEFMEYVQFIEQETGVPVSIISLGPDRDETIIR